MPLTDVFMDFDSNEYMFENSLESFNDDSNKSPTDMYFNPEESFLQHFSLENDIPLFLNSDEEEINLLNSFLDNSTNEILSEMKMKSSCLDRIDVDKNKLSLNNNCHQAVDVKPVSLVNDKDKTLNLKQKSIENKVNNHNIIKTTIESEKLNGIIDDKKVLLVNNTNNVAVPKNEHQIIFVSPIPTVTNITNPIPKVILPPVFINNKKKELDTFDSFLHLNRPIDPKILKKQQRKIKNRESACLSRKKKRDYVVSLETTVKNLTTENIKLKNENSQLKLKLTQYEKSIQTNPNQMYMKFKKKIAICMFFLVLGVNLNTFRFKSFNMETDITDTNLPILQVHHGRSLLSLKENVNSSNFNNITRGTLIRPTICPLTINQSESARLVLDLERWIGKPNNISQNIKPDLNLSFNKKLSKSRYFKKRRNLYENSLSSIYLSGKRNRKYPKMYSHNEIQVFSHNEDYTDFFEAINRQDDTFYVVSFSDHHMLLPALHHNGTRRPKMSLIMPTLMQNNLSHKSTVSLMQIDCEVQDTRLLNVNNGAIPQHLRKTGNLTTNKDNDKSKLNKQQSQKYKIPFKPFFINDTEIKSNTGDLTLN